MVDPLLLVLSLINMFLNLMEPLRDLSDKLNERRDLKEKNELFREFFMSDIEKIESIFTEIIGRTVKITLLAQTKLGDIEYEKEKLRENMNEAISRLRELRERMLKNEELVKTVLGENDWIRFKNYLEVFGKEKINVEELLNVVKTFYTPSKKEKTAREHDNDKFDETMKEYFTNIEFLEDIARKKVTDIIDCIIKCFSQNSST